jgi:glycosyltransferase involved in cell wall biosynthesis
MITVLIATRNGANTLPATLDAYCRLKAQDYAWKMVVVDNASTDATPAILETYARRLPLRSIRTEKRGKNVALNLALDELEDCALVVFSDDDIVPEPDWLNAIVGAAAQHPEFDVFGGRIVPVWPDSTPDWIFRLVDLGTVYAFTPPDLGSGPVAATKVWGGNMAIRSHVFAAGYRFDETVGPNRGQYVMGSEVEFTRRLERTGHRAWFIEDAVVGHIIRENQIRRDWIIQRAFRLGRYRFRCECAQLGSGVKLFRGAPRWTYRLLIAGIARYLKAKLLGDQDGQFKAGWDIALLRGYMYEAAQSGERSSSERPA